MFDRKKAAEYFVVAWCKNWSMSQYLHTVTEIDYGGDLLPLLDMAVEEYPWLTKFGKAYKHSVREFVGGAYPKLNDWLWSRKDDLARLKCAAQVERLKPAILRGFVRADDRAEMKASTRDLAAADAAYRASRDAFRTNQRSAWNVCKA